LIFLNRQATKPKTTVSTLSKKIPIDPLTNKQFFMKKVFTLLWLILTAFTFKAAAQTTPNCSAEFAVQYLNNYTVKFNPVVANDSPWVHHYWNFGDGSTGTTLISPTHTYSLAGTYSVVHTQIRLNQNNLPVCTQVVTKLVIIQEPCNLVVNFSWTSTTANPLTMAFQNLSVPLASSDSITWNFGDNTTSHDVNPVHTYANAGTYNVCLIVKKNNNTTAAPCIRYICKTVVVTTPCTLVANFIWTVTQTNPLRIEFTNLSTPLAATDSITWTFGDGTSSTVVNPVHIYANAGTYTVCLRVKKVTPAGSAPCVREICKTITVTQPCNLVVDYSWTATASNPLRIEFHNLSVPLAATDSVTWIFGDNSPNSHDVNPVHIYSNAGSYNVCLIVKKFPFQTSSPCIRYICKTVVVQAPCTLVADFSWTATATNPLRIEFHNLSTPLSNTDSVRWTFGDGSSSNDVNPAHSYANAGTYIVCLRVQKLTPPGSAPCVREICKTIVVTLPCNMAPNFTWTVSQTNPLRIEFQNTSTNTVVTDSVRWTFGDGSSSNQINPVHTYNAAGTYTVCLRIVRYYAGTTTPCVREICKTLVIPPLCTLVADFSSQADPNNTLSIRFTNLSVPVGATDSLTWSFGDGTTLTGVQGNPAVANPTHVYAHAGNYNVCLIVKKTSTASNAPCVRYTCKPVVVYEPCTLVVNFTSQPDPNHSLRIKFTNTSAPINNTDSVRWTFGDGSSVSGLQSDPNVANPTHIYSNAGNYTVCLRVKKNGNTQTPVNCVREKCATIVVTPPCNFDVNFSWRLDSVNVKKVYFTNLTVPPTATAIAVWTFGDGSSATSWNAVHEYAQPGTYRVCLRVYLGTNTNCVREKCDTVVVPVPVPPCTQLSYYHFASSPNDNQRYTFTPDYINPAFQYTWTFGDGTGSHDPVAIHRYAQPGVFVACLTVWRSNTCASTTCKEIRVLPQINCDTAHVGYSFQRNTTLPNTIQFTANATLPILDQIWTITKIPGGSTVTLHQNNPAYTFPDTGYYRVCLRATLQGGCVKEYCSNIRIENLSNACLLQVFPNPATVAASVIVTLTQPEMIHAYVYNSLNVLVMQFDQQGTTGANTVSFNVGQLTSGQYTIKLVYGNSVCYGRFQKL
jgi:PKD repeat protein